MKQRLGAHALLSILQERGWVAAHAAPPEFASVPLASRHRALFFQSVSGWVLGVLLAWLSAQWCQPQTAAQALWLGVGLLSTAWGLLRAHRHSAFAASLSLALSLAGQLFLALALAWQSSLHWTLAAGAWLLMQAVLLWGMPHKLHRSIAAFLSVLVWAWAWRWALPNEPAWANSATWLPVGAGLLALVRCEATWMAQGGSPVVRPLLVGWMWALAWGPMWFQPWFTPLSIWPFFCITGAVLSATAAFSLCDATLARWALAAAALHAIHAAICWASWLWAQPWWLLATGWLLVLTARGLGCERGCHIFEKQRP